jgi:hypothetical protein
MSSRSLFDVAGVASAAGIESLAYAIENAVESSLSTIGTDRQMAFAWPVRFSRM